MAVIERLPPRLTVFLLDRRRIICAVSLFLLIWGATTASPARAAEEDEIRALLTAEAEAWNRGDIERFMLGYSEQARYASCDDPAKVIYGRDKIREYYGSQVGVLTLSVQNIETLAPNVASVFLRWSLRSGKDEKGVSWLLFRKMSDGWKITADQSAGASC
jgi:ketosteroid isomerase-like protein